MEVRALAKAEGELPSFIFPHRFTWSGFDQIMFMF